MRVGVVAWLALLALLALLTAAPAQAIRTSKLARRSPPSAAAVPPAAAAPAPPAFLATAESAVAAAGESAELVQSIKQLLEEKKADGEAARAKLEAAAQHTLAVEAALAAKQQQLQSHSAMLARLEQCLAQGPAEARYSKMEAEARAQQQSLLEQQSGVEAKSAALAAARQQLAAQQAQLEAQAHDLADKEAHIAQQEAHVTEQQAMLEQQARSVAAQESAIKLTVAEQVEQRLAAKLEAAKAELQARSEERLAAVRAAMQAQTQTLLKAQESMLLERRASRIASRHEMRALTSPDESPYARASDAALGGDAAEPVLMEMGARSFSAPVPAPVSNSTLSVWARRLAAHCNSYSSCDKCGADGRCAWCSSSSKCMALDVNANLRAGSVSGDGLTSGQCASDAWQTSVASRLTLLSLNVFASERANSTRRFAAIVQLIKKSGADVIALQEVEKWFVHALQAHSWLKANYHLSEYGPGQAPGGLAILSRYPIASVQYMESILPGQVEVSQRARVLVAKLGVKQQALYVATTALDSRSSENRAASLEFIFRVLKPYRHVFLLGDFNFDEGSKIEAAAIPAAYLDLWPTLVSDRPGFTWDPRSNWFAAASDPQSRASRIDRVYLRSNQWMPRSIHLVGCSVSDPLCGAKNLDVKQGVTLVDANKLNPALILAAPTNSADKRSAADAEWGTKIPAFLEADVTLAASERQQVADALAHEADLAAFVEMGVRVGGPKPTFEPDFVASNHYGLLVQTTQFAPRCPAPEE